MRRRLGWLGVSMWLLVGCGEVTSPPQTRVLEDDAGRYTVTARGAYRLGAEGGLMPQALGSPALTLELRNYSALTPSARTRGVLTLTWPDAEVPLGGRVRVELETVEGERLAGFGDAPATGSATFTTPYVHQPDVRLCVAVTAELRANAAGGDGLELSLRRRVCERSAQANQQDVLLASRTVDRLASQITTELRYHEGAGYRALVRYSVPDSSSVSEKLCLHEEGKATCKRSATASATFSGGGVAEFVTSYLDAPADLPLCATVPGVGAHAATGAGLVTLAACRSGGVELLKHHSYNDGINTNVVLLETPAGVIARATFSVPEGVSLYSWSEVEYVHGGEHESYLTLSGSSSLGRGVPGMVGPTKETTELGPLPGTAVSPCYSLGVSYSRPGEYPELIEMSGCVNPAAN